MTIGALAYLAGLVATAPARLIVEPGPATNIASVGGTVWRGRAVLAGGEVARWRWAPLRSLAGFGYAAGFRVDGAGTALTGRVRLRPGATLFESVGGTASATLVAGAFPRLPFACATALRVAVARFGLGGDSGFADGRLETDAAACTARAVAAPPVSAPPLLVTLTGATGRVAPRAHPRVTFATLGFAPGRLTIAFTPEGAAALPFATLAGTRIETDF
ncbi:hypothetical protein ACMT1E_14410 [Sphingomonas flavalba]|uniref:hypothetical protein n=1 Tax=Sphingomonas flavalba TaxID=2559804 RepID=UPI0039E09EC0